VLFFLNYRCLPQSFIWDADKPDGFPGVCVFAKKMHSVAMHAHDCIIAVCVKSVQNVNCKCIKAPFAVNAFIYISTKNISLPKGMTRKLSPKFIGPYQIPEDFGNHSFRVKLLVSLTRRGVHDVFHALLLRIHVPNNDQLFPGHLDTQIFNLEDLDVKWMVEKILEHKKGGKSAMFKVLFKRGNTSWLPYDQLSHLIALEQYLEAMGISGIDALVAPLPVDKNFMVGMSMGILGTESLENYIKAQECDEGSPIFIPNHHHRPYELFHLHQE
jgi:hypothetical protein